MITSKLSSTKNRKLVGSSSGLPFAFYFLLLMAGCVQLTKAAITNQANMNEFPSSPRDVVNQLRLSIEQKNESRFLNCFTSDNAETNCLHQVYRKVQATISLKEAMEDTYGKGAWSRFLSTGNGAGRLIPSALPLHKEWWDGIMIMTNAGQATILSPITDCTNTLISVNGAYKIKAATAFRGGESLNDQAAHLKVTADVLDQTSDRIRNGKIAFSEISSTLYKDIMAKEKN